MQAEAIFENIADRILTEVAKAQHSIYVAVAWFTNRQIFNVLVDKANQGCEVLLMYANYEI